jgi:hypothetical protein
VGACCTVRQCLSEHQLGINKVIRMIVMTALKLSRHLSHLVCCPVISHPPESWDAGRALSSHALLRELMVSFYHTCRTMPSAGSNGS